MMYSKLGKHKTGDNNPQVGLRWLDMEMTDKI